MAIKQQVDHMLPEEIIQPSKSLCAYPIDLLKKEDGTLHFCMNYRHLNKIMKNVYPHPWLKDTLDGLCYVKYFSLIDLLTGCWQI